MKQLCISAKNSLAAALLLAMLAPLVSAADPVSDLAARLKIWKLPGAAPLCKDKVTGLLFPAKQSADQAVAQDCDDGDATLFNALLCYSGEASACTAVARAQVRDASGKGGEWKRSPRFVTQPSLRPSNSFSPDMALGLHLYAAHALPKSPERAAYAEWAGWIEQSRPCVLDIFGACLRGLPRLCTDDTEKGCTMRPGDLAIMRANLDQMGIPAPPPAPLPAISDSVLKLLKIDPRQLEQVNDLSFERLSAAVSQYSVPMLFADSVLNEEGFPQHLVAVGILVSRQRSSAADDFLLKAAAKNLADKQPKNAFFHWLAGGTKVAVAERVNAVCPKSLAGIPTARDQWVWERADNDPSMPAKSLMVWDCIFMANVVAKMP